MSFFSLISFGPYCARRLAASAWLNPFGDDPNLFSTSGMGRDFRSSLGSGLGFASGLGFDPGFVSAALGWSAVACMMSIPSGFVMPRFLLNSLGLATY